MKTIVELTRQIDAELSTLLPTGYRWDHYACCRCGGRVLYGPHIDLVLYTQDTGNPEQTKRLGLKAVDVFRKYYSRCARYYRAHKTRDGGCVPSRDATEFTILIGKPRK